MIAIGGKQITTSAGIIGRVRISFHGGRAAADDRRGAVPRVQGDHESRVGWIDYRHGGSLSVIDVSVRHTRR